MCYNPCDLSDKYGYPNMTLDEVKEMIENNKTDNSYILEVYVADL